MKFVMSAEGHQQFQQMLLPNLAKLMEIDSAKEGAFEVSYQQKKLTNQYFDTKDFYFAEQRFGFRVRGCDGQFEQTLKTHGSTTGGLHQRGEYNIEIESSSPDLTLFKDVEWPGDRNGQVLTDDLEQRFATNFVRDEYAIQIGANKIELVFDSGEVEAGVDITPIQEVEIELINGDVDYVFRLARLLNQYLALRLSDTTKAAAGYILIGESLVQRRELPDYLPLTEDCSTEDALCQAIQLALSHWQHHEQAYTYTLSLKYLDMMMEGVQLLMQSIALYLPVLQCAQLLALHRQLIAFVQKWQWLSELHNIRYLRSKRGPFSKYLNDHESLMSYLQGRKVGLLQGRSPEELLLDKDANKIKILASEILLSKPWRTEVNGSDKPVLEHARGWLSQGWQNVMQSLSQSAKLTPSHYVATDAILRQALTNGFLLAELFADNRGDFRAPWSDIIIGTEELRALLTLQQLLTEAEFNEDTELKAWTADKLNNLLSVIERTRRVAIRQEAYW